MPLPGTVRGGAPPAIVIASKGKSTSSLFLVHHITCPNLESTIRKPDQGYEEHCH